MARKRILALDMATKTGWAHTNGRSGVVNFGGRTSSEVVPLEVRLWHFRKWLRKTLDDWKTHAVVYEEAHFRGGAATRSGVGMQTVLLVECCDRRMPCRAVHTATLKVHATGNGKATKDAMLAAAIRQHPTVRLVDDNHVDALWLLHWAHGHL